MIRDGLDVMARGRWARVLAPAVGMLLLACRAPAASGTHGGDAREPLASESPDTRRSALSERLKSSVLSSEELSSRQRREQEDRLRQAYFLRDAVVLAEFHVGARLVEAPDDPWDRNDGVLDDDLVREQVTLDSIRQDLRIVADRLTDVGDSPFPRIAPADRLGVLVLRAPQTEHSGRMALLIPATANAVDPGAGLALEDFLARLPERQGHWLVLLDGCWRSSRMPEEAPVPELAANVTLLFGFDTSHPRCEQGLLGAAARHAVDEEKHRSGRHLPELAPINQASIITRIAGRYRTLQNQGVWLHAGAGPTARRWRRVP